MNQGLKNFALITLIVALILTISVVAVIVEQGSRDKSYKVYSEDKKASAQADSVNARR